MTLQFTWDHTVHYVNDLDAAIATFADHGLRAFRGGSHTLWGTWNALAYFGLTYHEFLAIEHRPAAEAEDPRNVVVADAVRLLPDHEVLSRVALRTNAIDEAHRWLTSQGLSTGPIVDGKRRNPQGEWIEWRMFLVSGDDQGLAYPFVIQWKGSDDERLAQLTQAGLLEPHPVGPVTLDAAVFSVRDPRAVANHWSHLFGWPAPSSHFEVPVADKAFRFQSGSDNALVRLEFSAPPPLGGTSFRLGGGEYRVVRQGAKG